MKTREIWGTQARLLTNLTPLSYNVRLYANLDAMKQSFFSFTKKKSVIGLVILAVITLIIAIGFYIPSQVTDGTEKFSGIELQAAQNALKHAKDIESGYFITPSKLHVDKVEATPNKQCDEPGNSNVLSHYAVTIKSVWLFGSSSTLTYTGCTLIM
jgi:hypothetical protein